MQIQYLNKKKIYKNTKKLGAASILRCSSVKFFCIFIYFFYFD